MLMGSLLSGSPITCCPFCSGNDCMNHNWISNHMFAALHTGEKEINILKFLTWFCVSDLLKYIISVV